MPESTTLFTAARKGNSGNNHWPGFLGTGDFRSALSREVALVERNGHRLALLTFAVSGQKSQFVRNLWRTLEQSTRIADQFGWLDSEHIAVILPFTSATGAEKLLSRVRSTLKAEDSTLPSSISTFPPSDSALAENGSSECPRPRILYESPESRELKGYLIPPVPAWKRMVDLVGAAMGLLVVSPLLILIALAIKVSSPGPVLFKQERIGFRGKPFSVLKFRTMASDVAPDIHAEHFNELIETEQPMVKLDSNGDCRVTSIGSLLRKPGLDELPQLFNVLRREMSLVGPRPCIRYEANKYRLWQTDRFNTPPGLTGLWQVSGKNKTSFNEMIRLDLAYVRKRSVFLDFKIILKTPLVMIRLALD